MAKQVRFVHTTVLAIRRGENVVLVVALAGGKGDKSAISRPVAIAADAQTGLIGVTMRPPFST